MTATDLAPTRARSGPIQTADATASALGQIERSISTDFPWASPDHISELLRAGFERTRDAKVQNYRLVLAERDTRAQLRHEQRRQHAGSSEGNDDR